MNNDTKNSEIESYIYVENMHECHHSRNLPPSLRELRFWSRPFVAWTIA